MAQHDAAAQAAKGQPAQPQPASAPPDAEQSNNYISEQFVKHYYGVLQNKPWQLHLFYKDHSMYTLHVPGGSSPTVHGGNDIKEKINEVLNGSCEVKQLSWSHQLSLSGSIVLSVAGELVNKQNASIRRFAQTFVLACENGSRNAFYIHNDICCFFDIGQVASLPVAVPQPPPQQTEALQPKTPVKEAAPSPIPASPTFGDAGAPAQDEEPVELKLPQQAAEEKPPPPPLDPPAADAEAAPEETSQEAAQDTPAEPTESQTEAPPAPKPTSWAGLAAVNCPKPVEVEKAAPRKPGPPGSAGNKQDSNTTEAPTKDEEPPTKEDPNASVFVSGVPNGCEKENLQSVMAQFGDVERLLSKPTSTTPSLTSVTWRPHNEHSMRLLQSTMALY